MGLTPVPAGKKEKVADTGKLFGFSISASVRKSVSPTPTTCAATGIVIDEFVDGGGVAVGVGVRVRIRVGVGDGPTGVLVRVAVGGGVAVGLGDEPTVIESVWVGPALPVVLFWISRVTV